MSVQEIDYPVDPGAIAPETASPAPYPPSFVDRIMDWFERLPLPYGLVYLALFILLSFLNHLLAWRDGWLPRNTFNAVIVVFPVWLCGALAIMTYLNSTARAALANFRPLLDLPAERLRRLEAEFTTMPARSVILSSVIWGVIYIVFVILSYQTVVVAPGYGPLFSTLIILEGLITWSIACAIYYHTLRQLSLVSRTVKLSSQFDLFNREPVYAFSVLTARTGAAWVFLLSVTMLLFPINLAPLPVLTLLVLWVGLAVAAFLLPLQIVNQRLVVEKRKLLGEMDQQVKATLKRLHRCLNENHQGEIDAVSREIDMINKAIAGLNAERDLLVKIPTWPWRPGLFSGFISVLMTPILLYIIQHFLEIWLGW